MTTRTRRKTAVAAKPNGAGAAKPSPTAAVATPEGWVGLTRDQLEFTLQSAMGWLRAVESVRKVQWDMTHLAVKRYEDMAQRLHEARDIADVMAIQVELMRFDSAAAIRFGQELYDTAVRNATEVLTQARPTVDASQADGVQAWMQGLQSMMHTGVRPLDDLFSQSVLRDLMTPAARAV
ncbi:MAG: phasin family protein [Burkholderiaceae bacterium]